MRKLLFKTIQNLKGGKFFHNIDFMEENYGNYSDTLRNERFLELLNHAIKTTNYYKDYNKYKQLSDCPPITKEIIKKNYDDFLSNLYNKEELVTTTTSGSYGTPFTFYFTKEKKDIQRSDVIFFSRWANFDIGVKHGHVMTREKSKVTQFIQNQYSIIPYEITPEWLEQERQLIKKRNIKILIGYPSAIGSIASYFIANDDYYKLDGVITVSENLSDQVKENIKKAFGVIPLSRYTTEELGALAMQCSKEQKFHLNQVNFIIEVLNENGEPVKPGEQGEVVVTDLYSHAMPLIRYRTGDLAILGKGTCKCGLNTPYLDDLLGRQLETIYTPERIVLSSLAINASMRNVEHVRQFQFIQTGEYEYTFNIVKSNEKFNENEIIIIFEKLLGPNAVFIFNYLEDIPPLKSGKRPYILQRFYKE